MTIFLTRRGFAATVLGTTIIGARSAAASVTINGGGSSFVNPVMQRWVETLPPSLGVDAKFAVLGAGAAQTKIMAGELDFAAMELPLPADKLEVAGLHQFPLVFGALAFVVNIDGIRADQLTLDGQLLGKIYAGSIKTWNDPLIVKANPGLTLPDQPIRPFHLGDPSGSVFSTTVTIQQYLLANNEDWRARHGATITKRWAVGSMNQSAAQMIDALKVVPGSVGYVALAAAMGGGMTTVRLRNVAGKTVSPSRAALIAAVNRIDWTKSNDMVANLIDLPGEASWPIVLSSYALIQRVPANAARGEAVRSFLRHVVTDGAAAAAERQAAGLPDPARDLVVRRLALPAG